jgi:DeoR family suf operon transcriptional repressor
MSLEIPGFRGIRADLLLALKKKPQQTAQELGETFGLTANALRRHLKELEAEGIVGYRREVRGVGAPVYAYSLTPAGESLFPRAYAPALATALELLREQQGPDGVRLLFERQWAVVAAEAKAALSRRPLAERAQLLAELLTAHGYMAEAEAPPDGGGAGTTIREHNCVVREVAERFPEVCAAEEKFLTEVLGAPVERHAHIASGGSCCEYCVQQPATLKRGERALPLRGGSAR